MQRRGESEQPVKGQRTSKPKGRKATTAHVATADLQEQLDRRTRELEEALQRETATSEVLRVISSFPERSETGIRDHLGERNSALRRQVRHGELV